MLELGLWALPNLYFLERAEDMSVEKFLYLMVGVLVFAPLQAVAEFRVDVAAQTVRDAQGVVTLGQLAVTETALVTPYSLCRKGKILYAPTNATARRERWDESFLLELERRPGKSVVAKVVEPTNSDYVNVDEVVDLIDALRKPSSFFSEETWSCDSYERARPDESVEFYPVESIEGKTTLSELWSLLKGRYSEKSEQ